MNQAEKEFMVQMAMGVFKIDQQGLVWRMGRWVGGSKTGSPSYLRMYQEPKRAETSEKTGYPVVIFTVEQKRHAVAAHRIVWMIFAHMKIPSGMEINHKDGNKKNHHPQNLEVATRQQNSLHAGRVLGVLGKKKQSGSMNAMAKLTEIQVAEIREMCRNRSMAQSRIAKMYGVKQATVSAIHLKKSWTS